MVMCSVKVFLLNYLAFHLHSPVIDIRFLAACLLNFWYFPRSQKEVYRFTFFFVHVALLGPSYQSIFSNGLDGAASYQLPLQ